jgi:hypothetical protein
MSARHHNSFSSHAWFGPLLGFIIGAITVWPIPYDQLTMGGATMSAGWVIFCGMAGAYMARVTTRQLPHIAVLVSGGVVGAVMLRIIVEVAIDPTDHNLWPFEIVLTMLICFPSALCGAWLSRLIARQQ